MVQRNVPLAQRVVQAILNEVRNDSLVNEDGMLPSESRLAQQFEVSRATVREALANLEQQGIVVRRQGIGTFIVSTPRLAEWNLGHLAEGLSTWAERSGLEWHVDNTVIEERPATSNEALTLKLSVGSQVLSYERVILIEGERVANMKDVAPTSLLSIMDLGDPPAISVWDILREKEELTLSHALTDLTVEAPPSAVSNRLQVKSSYMLLKLESRMLTMDDNPVDYTLAYFVPGRFKFRLIRPVG